MNALPLVIIAILIFLLVNIEIDSNNPCSSFSNHQSECNSDNYRH